MDQHTHGTRRAVLAVSLFLAAALLPLALSPAARAEGEVTRFETPAAALQAVVAALEKGDRAAMTAIFGPDLEDIAQDDRDPAVQAARKAFVEAAKAETRFEARGGKDRVVAILGPQAWPFPIPLVKEEGGWRFDTAAGKDEVYARRIGANELTAIDLCKEYVAAQVAYASKDRDGDEVREYAQKFLSTPGTRDGLYWPADTSKGEEESPFGPLVQPFEDFVKAREAGATPAPFHGYVWRILLGQGANAPGGAHSYLINGNMLAGFALVGVPAQYRETGVMTFLVSNHGTIYQKDLGEKSLETAKAMETFDPDDTWTEIE